MLELYYNFLTKICDNEKFQEIEIDTDSMYLAVAEKEMFDCIRREKRQEWDLLRGKNCRYFFTAGDCSNFFSGPVVLNTKIMIKESLVCSNRNFDSLISCFCVAGHTAVTALSATIL